MSTPAPSLAAMMQLRIANSTPVAPVAPAIPATLTGGAKADLPELPPARRRFITLNEVAPETATGG